VKIQSGQFDKKYPHNDFQRIRSHSGRAICFALMMGEGVPFPLSMKFARHAQGSLKIHLGHGRLTVVDIHKYLVERRSSQIPGRNLEVVPAEKTKRKTGVEDCSLKDLVFWHERGRLRKTEFCCAKAKLMGIRDGFRNWFSTRGEK
jgi:hypothetical protein